ncbi:MAG: polysaccharide biosynthesis C-terminal domain-containing protein [Clostridia bacterium]|nr:polysaccharide biosynthesis C-terminal domain-containing protein [Clostridia bacterium]
MGFQVYLTQRIGSEGIGLFELLMSVYGLSASLAVSGVRLSTTRLVLEVSRRSGDGVVRLCLTYALLLGTGAGVLLYVCSGPAAALWLDAPELARCLRVLAFTLPCLSVSSCVSGLFSARRQAGRMALIQVLEFALHMALTIGGLAVLRPSRPAEACLVLVCSSCLCDGFSAALALVLSRRERTGGRLPLEHVGDLLSIALPDALGSWVRSGLVSAKHVLIPKGLRRFGAGSAQALSSYGMIQGMVMPVLGFPAAVLGTVSGLLVPEIAESHANGQQRRLTAIMERVLHLTLLFSLFTGGILLVYGGDLGRMLYRSAEVERYIRLLAPLVPLMYLDTTVDGMLKGMGLQKASMGINIVDAAVSLLLVWQLIPRVGLKGYLLTLYVSETLNFLLSFRQLNRHAGLRLPFYRSVLAPLMAAMCAIVLPRLVPGGGQPVALMVCSLALYYVLLRLLGSVTRRDIRWFLGIFRKK